MTSVGAALLLGPVSFPHRSLLVTCEPVSHLAPNKLQLSLNEASSLGLGLGSGTSHLTVGQVGEVLGIQGLLSSSQLPLEVDHYDLLKTLRPAPGPQLGGAGELRFTPSTMEPDSFLLRSRHTEAPVGLGEVTCCCM